MNKPTKNFNIFIVEDNLAEYRLLEIAFTKCGNCTLRHFPDGEELIQYLAQNEENNNNSSYDLPNLIITDYSIPKISGLELIKKLNETEKLRIIPVILLTGSASEEIITQAYRAHVNCIIHKPDDIAEYEIVAQSIIDHWLHVVSLPYLVYRK